MAGLAADALGEMDRVVEIDEAWQVVDALPGDGAVIEEGLSHRLERRGLLLGRDGGDPYAQGLQKLVRAPRDERLLDQLLVSALIEERSRERLSLLSTHLIEPALRDFYARLAKAEAGHCNLFLRLARRSSAESMEPRLAVLAREEAALVARLPLRAAIH